MGTSGPYVPSPNWANIKGEVTTALNAGTVSGEEAKQLIGDFANQLCAEPVDGFGELAVGFGHISPDQAAANLHAVISHLPARVASAQDGRGGGSRGGGSPQRSTAAGRGPSSRRVGATSVRPTAQRLASFISEVSRVGLRQALEDAGVSAIDLLRPDQIALAIADVLAADASQIIQTELRDALATVMEELCPNPASFDETSIAIATSSDDLVFVIQRFFECYIMERFKTFFCEHEASKHGFRAADAIIREARRFVAVELDLVKGDHRDFGAVDWAGDEGSGIVDAILERTIVVYAQRA